MGGRPSQDPAVASEVLFMVDFNQTMKELVPVDVHEFSFPSNIYGYLFVGACLLVFFTGLLIFRLYRHWIDGRIENGKRKCEGVRRDNPRD